MAQRCEGSRLPKTRNITSGANLAGREGPCTGNGDARRAVVLDAVQRDGLTRGNWLADPRFVFLYFAIIHRQSGTDVETAERLLVIKQFPDSNFKFAIERDVGAAAGVLAL